MLKNLKRWKEERIGKIRPSLNTCFIWSFIALFAAADAIGLKAEGISLAPHTLLPNIVTITILLTLSLIYTYFRRVARIAALTHMAAAFLAFTATTAISSYLTVAWQRPLIDDYLVAIDHALGIDWLAAYKWVIERPLMDRALRVAYFSLIPQIILLLLVLNFRGHHTRGWEMLWLFMISCIGCVLFSGLWPAAGAFAYYHIETGRPYVQVFTALHNGTLRVFGDTPVQGIIQFPSFHVALAILLTYVVRGMKILFLFLLELNTLLFFSTPAIGGHHFADLWGGIVLALVTILVVRIAFAAGLVPETGKI